MARPGRVVPSSPRSSVPVYRSRARSRDAPREEVVAARSSSSTAHVEARRELRRVGVRRRALGLRDGSSTESRPSAARGRGAVVPLQICAPARPRRTCGRYVAAPQDDGSRATRNLGSVVAGAATRQLRKLRDCSSKTQRRSDPRGRCRSRNRGRIPGCARRRPDLERSPGSSRSSAGLAPPSGRRRPARSARSCGQRLPFARNARVFGLPVDLRPSAASRIVIRTRSRQVGRPARQDRRHFAASRSRGPSSSAYFGDPEGSAALR